MNSLSTEVSHKDLLAACAEVLESRKEIPLRVLEEYTGGHPAAFLIDAARLSGKTVVFRYPPLPEPALLGIY